MTKSTPKNAHRRPHYELEVHSPPNEKLLARRFSIIDGGLANGKLTPRLPGPTGSGSSHAQASVEISPLELVRRRTIVCPGLTAESVQAASHAKVEYNFQGPTHLLVIYEDGARSDGQTCVQGLSQATLRRFAHKFTFVPAGHQYHEYHELRVLSRLMYFYFHPGKLIVQSNARFEQILSSPRVFFEDEELWHSAMKLKNLIENPELGDERYFQALGIVLAYRLLHLQNGNAARNQSLTRGGLAAWQQRITLAYIEEHISEHIELATLAKLVRKSRAHFCRAFKHSFGMPPLRYQAKQRIEQAKILLASPEMSVTEIALTVGFGNSSSFATAFRKATGVAPTEYQRSLG